MAIEADSEDDATQKVEQACKKLLANLIMESYTFKMQPA
ncbi:phosphoribosylformylglycinamidine synthase subunit PurS [uncultured Mucilaginibacter sp.]|nr:phosphoribosylformylglycinamidine synthase subunit PurS [uncultured Mucilaginibacter sp.]